MNNIDNFNGFITRGEIRKNADNLLDMLSVAYLNNLASDYRNSIKDALREIENSNIDWEKDVVKSVREKYKQLTNLNTINTHMTRW